jgi:phosphocarrier protein
MQLLDCTDDMPASKVTCRVSITNPQGLHLRPAMVLSQHAQRFPCVIRAACGDRQGDAKSILDLICLAAVCGSELLFEAHGPNSTEALDSLQQLVRQQFEPPDERMLYHDKSND